MSIGLIYWILMLIWLVFGVWTNLPAGPNPVGKFGGTFLLFILLLLLGWKTFGAPIHG